MAVPMSAAASLMSKGRIPPLFDCADEPHPGECPTNLCELSKPTLVGRVFCVNAA